MSAAPAGTHAYKSTKDADAEEPQIDSLRGDLGNESGADAGGQADRRGDAIHRCAYVTNRDAAAISAMKRRMIN
jgi:hypothetical protein